MSVATRDGKPAAVSGDHVFRERQDGGLVFVGDFDGLYRSDPDPWGQRGGDERLAAYYDRSRNNLVRLLAERPTIHSVLEAGCGFGQVCRHIREALPDRQVAGADISAVAIEQAKRDHPDILFFLGDVTDPGFARDTYRFDALILNQLLWYLLERLPTVLDNAARLIPEGGVFIICNAFMRSPQRYGREIIDGFDGLIRYLANHTTGRFSFIDARLTSDPGLLYDDGCVVLQRMG